MDHNNIKQFESTIRTWNLEQTKNYLKNNNIDSNAIEILCDTNKLDGQCLLLLNDSDFNLPPISNLTLHDRKILYYLWKKLQKNDENRQYLIQQLGIVNDSFCAEHHLHYHRSDNSYFSEYLEQQQLQASPTTTLSEDGVPTTGKPRLPPEKMKAFLSFLYVVGVTWITAFVMVIVHDRVPDMKKYPPLPDIFLDNVPHIPWAFDMCEVTGTLMFTIWLFVLLFHRHR